ncbi:MAG: hypothetical protein ABR542_08915, partial [Desulfonatronovibrio sp.]
MKKKEFIKQIIRTFHLQEEFLVKHRDIDIPVSTGKIITIKGVRRCGKTSILLNTVNRLSRDIDKKLIIFINF